ncbi:MAG TPA: hypothetical protein VFD58_31205 [Blastocatellia bacterium]|nr:hypothetical protein [Blastocatellia bacterium]
MKLQMAPEGLMKKFRDLWCYLLEHDSLDKNGVPSIPAHALMISTSFDPD